MVELTHVTDAELAATIARGGPGSAAAEAALCARFAPRVRAFGLRHLRDPVAADDLAQDVLVTVLSRLRAGEVRDLGALASFVLGTARLTATGARRRAHRHAALAERLASQPTVGAGPREVLDLDRLARCLERLGERERAVVVLTFHDERSGPEIGRALGLSAGNVRVIRHRAVGALQRCMGAGGDDR